MRHPPPALLLLACATAAWLIVLGCRVADTVARAQPTATHTPTRTLPRPTFTRVPPTQPPTDVPPPTNPPRATATRPPTPRPVVRPPTAVPPTPAPPPTPDPYAGYYYRPVNKGCVTAPNTRIEGTVYDNGVKKNGVIVRVSHAEHAEALIDDFVTGTDPSDYKHIAPERQGMYRLALYEGQQIDGNWWVFVVDSGGNPLSKGVYIKTHDGAGCNTATVDFVH